jgi:hypothetical protein
MPVVSYNLPLDTVPIQGTRARFLAWLVEHVGPVNELGVMYTLGYAEAEVFANILNEYLTVIGLGWPYRDTIDRIVVTRGENWSMWQLTADRHKWPVAPTANQEVYQYAVYIEDEILAMQFKLSCL